MFAKRLAQVHSYVATYVYRIVQNFGGAKLWQIWQNDFDSPNLTLQIFKYTRV